MRYVAVSVYPDRMWKLRKILPDVETFDGTSGCGPSNYRQVCIPDSFRRFAEWAVSEGLGRETIGMMDDVWIPHGPGFDRWISKYEDAPLLVLGQTMPSGFVDPRAFSATPQVWGLLSSVWRGEGRIWRDWDPIVREYGTVLDVTRML